MFNSKKIGELEGWMEFLLIELEITNERIAALEGKKAPAVKKPRKSKLKCDLCDYRGKSSVGQHKRVHKN